MDAFSALVSDVISSINDTLNVRGGEVSNLALSLINRARARIWQYKPWTYLSKSVTLTLDSDQESDLPDDFGRVHIIQPTETTRFPVYGFRHTMKSRRYDFVNTVSITTGITQKIKFYNSQTSLFMVYIQKIDNVTDNTNYLLFPANLVIRAAELIFAESEQKNQSKIKSLKDAYEDEIRDFQQYYHSNNAQMMPAQRDYEDSTLINDSISMLGD